MSISRVSRVGGVVAGAALVVTTTVSPAAAVSASSYEKQVITRTNTKRVQHDLVKVGARTCVDRYAERQARWMAKHQTMRHQSMGTILDACHLTGVAENIAYGYTSGNRVVTAWMKSPGHRANLLSSPMRYIGVGAVKDDDGTWWVSQVFGTKK